MAVTGVNPSSLGLSQEEFEDYAVGFNDASTITDVLNNLKERRENVLGGGVNCIPLPFKRFRSDFPGIEQGQYCIVSANQKTGKTQVANYIYLFHTLDYAFEHQDQCSVHIIYFALEEAIQKIIERYMSFLLYKFDNIRIPPVDLRSTSADNPVPENVLELLASDKYQERLHFFEECVQFETEDTNPTGILRVCEKYAKSVGTYISHKQQSHGNSFKEVEVFDSYVDNDPNHYKIVIIDHIGLVDKEQGFSTKQAIDKMSEYAVKYLRNRYRFCVVAIQQQASESEGLEAIKQKRMVPSTATLGDSKYTARDADIVIGLFDPSKFGLPVWLGYKIQDRDGTGLYEYARFMYILANRNGEMGGICPLFFDGAVCSFRELPLPDDGLNMRHYYDLARELKSSKHKKAVILTLIKKLIYGRKG